MIRQPCLPSIVLKLNHKYFKHLEFSASHEMNKSPSFIQLLNTNSEMDGLYCIK